MPTTEPIQGLELPVDGDDVAIPAHLRKVYDFLVVRGIPRYPTRAARDTALTNPTNGQVCWVDADTAVYVRSGGQWRVLWRLGGQQVWATSVSGVAVPAGGIATAVVAFPAGWFTSRPAVTVTSIASQASVIATVTAVTATGCTVVFRNSGASAVSGATADLIAAPMS